MSELYSYLPTVQTLNNIFKAERRNVMQISVSSINFKKSTS